MNQNFDFSSEGYQHRFDDCDFSLNQEASEFFAPALESSVSEEAKINLSYIAGYVTKNVDFIDEETHEETFEQRRTEGSRKYNLSGVYFLFYCFRQDQDLRPQKIFDGSVPRYVRSL